MGMFDVFQHPFSTQPIGNNPGVKQRIYPAHVVEVCMDESSPIYENPEDIGKIRFRDVGNLYTFTSKKESELVTVAWPLDRSVSRYPLPGEQVIVFEAFGDVRLPFVTALQRVNFYALNVASTHNITSNVQPFVQSNEYLIEKQRVPRATAEKRFEKKLIDRDKFKEGRDEKIYKQLKPYEGDFILQGRFGNSIRLGSTSAKEKAGETPWKSYGPSGDPIMVFRVNDDSTTKMDEMWVYEDISQDQSSMYLTSNQNVELDLQSTKKMKSWAAVYDIAGGGALDKVPTDSKLYEQDASYSKVVDVSKPIADEYKPTKAGDNGPGDAAANPAQELAPPLTIPPDEADPTPQTPNP